MITNVETVQATNDDQSDVPPPRMGQLLGGPTYVGPTLDLSGSVGVRAFINASPGAGTVHATGLEPGTILVERNALAGLEVHFRSPADGVDLFLENTRDGLSDNALNNSNDILVFGATGQLRVHVSSDSRVAGIGSGGLEGLTSLTVDGLGRLTAAQISLSPLLGFLAQSNLVDASASAGVSIGSYAPAAKQNTVILSGEADTIKLTLQQQVNTTVALGAGADIATIGTYYDLLGAGTTQPAQANLTITAGRVTTYATFTDFQRGSDQLVLQQVGSLTPGLTAFAAGATSLEQALAAVAMQVPARGTGVFVFGGDTWIFHQDGVVGANTGDGLIRLVGVTGLTDTPVGGADVRLS